MSKKVFTLQLPTGIAVGKKRKESKIFLCEKLSRTVAFTLKLESKMSDPQRHNKQDTKKEGTKLALCSYSFNLSETQFPQKEGKTVLDVTVRYE